MFDQEQAKLNNEQTKAEKVYATQAPNPAGDDCCVGLKSSREPLIYSLRRRARESEHQSFRNQRALEILEKHPEFEELLELLRLVPNY